MRRLYLQGAGLVRSALFLVLLTTAYDPVFSADSPVESNVDLRVLIDVSGSMKHNDPEYLRRAAVRLLIGLLPENARAGMWTFAGYVDMNVAPGQVNDNWRNKARKEADKIHSRGVFTNLEEVLQLSSFDWNKPDPTTRRTIIFLSDGVVDMSQDVEVNERSRAQILNEILPRLQQNNVTVHTVALSNEADHELLKSIAVATDGWYEKVERADNLQRIFLRLFEKSFPANTVPVQDNIFKVDESIEEMTLLVFRDVNSKPTRILMPDGKLFDSESHPNNVKWRHEKGFDLVTVNLPDIGIWRMDSKIDPDNRVMIMSNLKLSVNKQLNHILQGEEQVIYAKLLEDNAPVSDRMFLEHVDFSFYYGKPGSKTSYEYLLDNGESPDSQAVDGIYSTRLKAAIEGKYQISVIAEGPTIKRESLCIVKVHGDPVKADIMHADGRYQITLKNHLKLRGLVIKSFDVKLNDRRYAANIKKLAKDTWVFYLPQNFSGANMTVEYIAQVGDRPQVVFNIEQSLPE